MVKELNLKITPDQRLWLEAVYAQLKEGTYKNYRRIKAELYGKVSTNFHPRQIDDRLLRYGSDITILGVELIDPDFQILNKSNKVILAIRDILIQNKGPEEIMIDDVIAKTGLERAEIEIILRVAIQPLKFWTGMSSDASGTSRLSIGNDETFDRYISFESIEKSIADQLRDQEEILKAPPRVSKGKRVSLTSKLGLPTIRYEDAESDGDPTVEYKPVFTSRITHVNKMLCFVLMPFGETWSDQVYENIKEVLTEFDIQVLRADSLHGQIIIEDIWVQINLAAFVVVDVTNRNPNVMYELGIVHTIGKPAILLTQDIIGVPFDLKHHRHYSYEAKFGNEKKFREMLSSSTKALYKANYPEIKLNDV